MLTPYHAKYFAHELTKQSASDSMDKLGASLTDAQVDLNPHQIDAALFAFRSPLSKGAILADEVGLGKTIEAGILISQKWAERKRKILIICPANLRKQWSQELLDKFYLPSVILEAKSFNKEEKDGKVNPFDQNSIVLCSFQFARSKEEYLALIPWDLAVIDEAHKLRNVYKSDNKIANSIKQSLSHCRKVLLTATPLQNTLLELYGLVSIIDEYIFGDIKSFKSQFARLAGPESLQELKTRLEPVCKRTLRRQVLEYIKYTNRIAIVQEFTPRDDEQRLYDLVSSYLEREELFALPKQQRKLMTLILRKLLASSTFAIAHTFDGLAKKLQAILESGRIDSRIKIELPEDLEGLDELEEEFNEEESEEFDSTRPITDSERIAIEREIKDLQEFAKLAHQITENSKGAALLTALKKGFQEQKSTGAAPKALIFTESTRTQNYLLRLLEGDEYRGEIVLFNGSNNDQKSKDIYKTWLERHQGTDKVTGSKTADMRAALVEYFKDSATIMIATEAAAEGINLQFCSLVVNYDLPWNPQRIEQRIGRCHRYGQKYDVVVVNFLNKKNAADQRVYQLLSQKFHLFDGVFGASDDVLGAVESGIDFEKRIAEIYEKCRSEDEIQEAFDSLQSEMEAQIDEKMTETRGKLLENFDEEVHERLKVSLDESANVLGKFEHWLWQITRFYLQDHAEFSDDGYSFRLRVNPFKDRTIHHGPYRIGKYVEDANTYRVGHPLAQEILSRCLSLTLDPAEVEFHYSTSPKKISVVERLVGQKGWLLGTYLSLSAFETEEHILLAGCTDSQEWLDEEQCKRLFSVDGKVTSNGRFAVEDSRLSSLKESLGNRKKEIVDALDQRNGEFFEFELEKLDRWGDDRRNALKLSLKEFDDQIKELKKEARLAPNLPTKLKLEKERKKVESKRDEAWREFDEAAKGINEQKDKLLDEIEKKLKYSQQEEDLFVIRWHVV